MVRDLVRSAHAYPCFAPGTSGPRGAGATPPGCRPRAAAGGPAGRRGAAVCHQPPVRLPLGRGAGARRADRPPGPAGPWPAAEAAPQAARPAPGPAAAGSHGPRLRDGSLDHGSHCRAHRPALEGPVRSGPCLPAPPHPRLLLAAPRPAGAGAGCGDRPPLAAHHLAPGQKKRQGATLVFWDESGFSLMRRRPGPRGDSPRSSGTGPPGRSSRRSPPSPPGAGCTSRSIAGASGRPRSAGSSAICCGTAGAG